MAEHAANWQSDCVTKCESTLLMGGRGQIGLQNGRTHSLTQLDGQIKMFNSVLPQAHITSPINSSQLTYSAYSNIEYIL